MNRETTIPALIQKAYDKLKNRDLPSALSDLEEALRIDFEDGEVIYALKCVHWWKEQFDRLERFSDDFDKGGFLLVQWKGFYSFLDRIGDAHDACLYAVRHFVFSSALGFFDEILGDSPNQHDPGMLLLVGRCYKGIGQYDRALNFLEQATRFKRDDGGTLSELADVNALLGETRAAKALFREAFYADPQGVEIQNMESDLIILLQDRLMEMGISGRELLEWIPVYGSLFGVFSVKRELKPVEMGRLKQSIFSLENEIRSRPENVTLLIPRLINRYLWLIDHYENIQENPSLIEETLLKIKIIDPAIYERIR
jgi:tetratricopeptide (TPR) repeat protein